MIEKIVKSKKKFGTCHILQMGKFDKKSCKIYAKYDGKQKSRKKKDFCWKKKLLRKSFFIGKLFVKSG